MSHKRYFLPTIKVTNYNVTTDAVIKETFLIRNDIKYLKILKIATSQGDDYATCCFIDYPYNKNIS